MSAANRVGKTATCCGCHQRDADRAVLVPRPTTREPHHFPNVVNTDIERSTNPSFRSQSDLSQAQTITIGRQPLPHKTRLTQNANQSDYLTNRPLPWPLQAQPLIDRLQNC